jgi:3-oxoacyl-[acyl-carrier protein] reductase
MGVELSLEGKVVLVTGGSRGIGAETVRLFTQADARVVFNYRRAQGAADALVATCGGAEHCRAVQQDLGSAAEGRTLVEAATSVWGRLDALVVNHGVWPSQEAPIDRLADEQWRETMSINLDSVFGLVKAAVARFKAQGGPAHIVLVASTAAQRGEAFHADYAASKGALISLTKSLSSELAGHGISVNCVAPGWVATDMSAPALASEAGRNKIFASIPLGRVGTPAEIAGPILFLCTPWAGFISGEIVNVNGGAVLVG